MAVITLLTDFGSHDMYVGVMKGVILGLEPGARLVDLTHDVEPGDIAGAAFKLAEAWRFFPSGSVHLAVVDPGVGSARRPLAARAGGHFFVGPDNGLFTAVFEEAGEYSARELASEAHRLSPVSRTFHGRDIFAPAAAWLARGTALEELGPPLRDPVRGEVPAVPRPAADGSIRAAVVHVDVFGNLVTSIRGEQLEQWFPGGEPVLEWDGGRARRQVAAYAEAPTGEPVMLVGSSGRLEISVNRDSAARVTGLGRGDGVRLRPAGRGDERRESGTEERRG